MGEIKERQDLIKTFDLDNVEDENLPVEILWVDSPTSMWIRPVQSRSTYVDFTISMMEYYMDKGRGAPIADKDLVPGMLCAIVSSTTVQRGSIIYADDEGYSEILLVDFGCTDYYPKFRIYHLESEFKQTPTLAIHCGLSDVQPIDVDWTCSAQKFVLDLSLGVTAIATICMRVVENSSLWLKLSIQGFDIGEDLVLGGHALPHRQRLRCAY